MGLRDQIQAGASRLEETAREAAASSSALHHAVDGFQGLRDLYLADEERAIGPQHFLLLLVKAVRTDDRTDEGSERDVLAVARRRRRRLALFSVGAGPLIRVANQLSDLYCEAATFCHVADHHDSEFSDEHMAAHLLVLWNVADDLQQAQAAIDGTGDQTVSNMLASRLRDGTSSYLPETLNKRSLTKAFWDARGVVAGSRGAERRGAVAAMAFPGRRMKRVIARAETQLTVTGQ